MSVVSAVVFGLVLGITLFVLYLSFIAHHQTIDSNSSSPEGLQVSNVDNLKETSLLNPFRNRIKEDKTILSGELSKSSTQHDSLEELQRLENHEVKVVSLPKEELSALQKAHMVTKTKQKSENQEDHDQEMLSKLKQEKLKDKLSKFNELQADVACLRMKKKFHVVPSVTWGTLPAELQQ
jgi:spermidine/putrescine-binding protein